MKTIDYEALGERIRRFRKTRDLTQQKLSKMVGISLTFLGHIERGTRVPSLETVLSLSKALRVSIADLIPGEIMDAGSETFYRRLVMEIVELIRCNTDLLAEKEQ